MRITNKMMSTSYLKSLNDNLNSLNTLNNQLTTGKEISKPSDNPYKTARIMQLYGDISKNNQYNENIKDTSNWLSTTDTALGQLSDSIQRIRELMVSAGNSTYGEDELSAIKDEVNEKISEVAQILNTTFDGKYIFGGTKTSSKPVSVVTDDNGNNKLIYIDATGADLDDLTEDEKNILLNQMGSSLKVEVSNGVTLPYNVGATSVLSLDDGTGTSDVNGVINLLYDIVNNLSGDTLNTETLLSDNLNQVDEFLANISSVRGEVGAKINRMESAQTSNEELTLNLKSILSDTEDIDLAEKTIELSTLQTVYQASLQVSSSIVQLSILNYL